MKFSNLRLASFAVLLPFAIACSGCSQSKQVNGAAINKNEIPPSMTIASEISGKRTLILIPLIVVREVPETYNDAPGSNMHDAAPESDRQGDRLRVTFDSVFRQTVLEESAARSVPPPVMPADSLRAYDSLAKVGQSGKFDIAIVPDQIELLPGHAAGDDGNDLSGETQGIRPDSPGMPGGGGGGPRGGGHRSRGSGHGGAVGIRCTFTLVRGSDNRTIFSGVFTNPSVNLAGRGALAAGMRALCEQFLQWKSQ